MSELKYVIFEGGGAVTPVMFSPVIEHFAFLGRIERAIPESKLVSAGTVGFGRYIDGRPLGATPKSHSLGVKWSAEAESRDDAIFNSQQWQYVVGDEPIATMLVVAPQGWAHAAQLTKNIVEQGTVRFRNTKAKYLVEVVGGPHGKLWLGRLAPKF